MHTHVLKSQFSRHPREQGKEGKITNYIRFFNKSFEHGPLNSRWLLRIIYNHKTKQTQT